MGTRSNTQAACTYVKLIIKRFEASMTDEHDENKQSRMKGLTQGQERTRTWTWTWTWKWTWTGMRTPGHGMVEACEMQQDETRIRCQRKSRSFVRWTYKRARTHTRTHVTYKKKTDRELPSNDLNRREKWRTSGRLLTLLPGMSYRETLLDAVTSRILVVVRFSTGRLFSMYLLFYVLLALCLDVTG